MENVLNKTLYDKLYERDSNYAARFKLSENPDYPITQNYIYELLEIVTITSDKLTIDEYEGLTKYVTDLYSRIKVTSPSSSIIFKGDNADAHTECRCTEDKPYNFCFQTSIALVKCKNFKTAIKYIPLLELFLVYTTDFYKDTKYFTICNTEQDGLLLTKQELNIIASIINIFNNYDIKSKIILIFIIVETIVRYGVINNNINMAKVLYERITELKGRLSSHITFRLIFRDIITRCKCSSNILDEWLAITLKYYKPPEMTVNPAIITEV
jgi:hypothetical protein